MKWLKQLSSLISGGREESGAEKRPDCRVKRKAGVEVMPYFKEESGCDRMFLVGCSSKETF